MTRQDESNTQLANHEIERCAIAGFKDEWPSVKWEDVGEGKKNAWRRAAKAIVAEMQKDESKELAAARKVVEAAKELLVGWSKDAGCNCEHCVLGRAIRAYNAVAKEG